jgi:hypothetical protein
VKASGKQINGFTEMSRCIGSRREIEASKSVPAGSPMGHNEVEFVSTSAEPSVALTLKCTNGSKTWRDNLILFLNKKCLCQAVNTYRVF